MDGLGALWSRPRFGEGGRYFAEKAGARLAWRFVAQRRRAWGSPGREGNPRRVPGRSFGGTPRRRNGRF